MQIISAFISCVALGELPVPPVLLGTPLHRRVCLKKSQDLPKGERVSLHFHQKGSVLSKIIQEVGPNPLLKMSSVQNDLTWVAFGCLYQSYQHWKTQNLKQDKELDDLRSRG